MWFYALRNQQQGPVNMDVLKTLLQDRTIDGSTLVWKEGMPQWTPLAQTELARMLPAPTAMTTAAPMVPTAPAYPQQPVAPGSYQPYNTQLMKPAAVRIKELNNTFTAYWILLLAGTVTAVIFIGIPGLIAAAVLQYILLYRFWETIQSIHPRTTPGKAVGYLFIPFFGIYWIWEAFHGLSKDMNTYMNVNGIPGERLEEGLSLAFCILMWCSIIPYVDFLTAPAAGVIFIILMVKWKKAACAIIAQQQ
jgi:hypothetical protein